MIRFLIFPKKKLLTQAVSVRTVLLVLLLAFPVALCGAEEAAL